MTADLSMLSNSRRVEAAFRRVEVQGTEVSIQDTPCRVLHVIPHLGGGGSERFVLTLLPLLDRRVCEPKLCVLGSIDAFPSRTAQVEGVRFLGYDGSLRNLPGMRRCVRSLREIIVQDNIEIVHSHLWPAARLAGMALRGLPVEHIVQVQDTRPWLAGKGWKDRLLRLWTNRSVPGSNPNYIAVSNAVKEYTCRHLAVDASSVSVIPNGVDLNRFRPKSAAEATSDGTLVVGMVALMKPEKGHQYLIEAVSLLAQEGLDVELRLAGDGSLRPCLEAMAETADIADRVVFAGLVDDVESFLHGLDVFVLASAFGEGLPLTILEAMACRIPVIACDVAGACEVIDHGRNGILVPSQNSTALAKATREMAGNSTRREEIACAGLETVRAAFSFHSVARQIESLYTELRPSPQGQRAATST